MNIAATMIAMGGPEGLGVVCTPGGCFQVAVLVKHALIALSGIIGILATLSYLSDARTASHEEHSRVQAETDALKAFVERVRSLAPDSPASRGAGPTTTISTGSSTGTQQIRAAYEETLMAVDHYDEDYGEPLAQNMQSELGPDVTNAVVSGSPLSPGLQQAVVAAAETCITQREAFSEELATEMDALANASAPLQSIERALTKVQSEPRIDGFDELADRWERLDRMEHACTEVVNDRRASLADRDAFDLAEYLYSSTGTPFPVLASAAALASEIHAERQRTTDMLTRVV
ncbi:DUF7260 family protein [Halorarius litoreus]|uniref:DUF7260 family protein n=1 Tax=Halorarius litoreus TaxID=2962676 RepID=UPI0020CF6391|nr:hypothetical protein [Halorarius litoreus]